MVSRFLIFCSFKFPTLLEEILLQILKLPAGKNIILSSMSISERPIILLMRPYLRPNTRYLFNVKTALEKLLRETDEKFGEDIIDIIHEVEIKLKGQENKLANTVGKSRFDALMKNHFDNKFMENLKGKKPLPFAEKLLGKNKKPQSKCSYCGKIIKQGQDICEWCGHKKDDDEGGFFPYPFIFKPPGGGGGSMKEAVAVSVKVWAQA